jgi:hypothetical protein
MHLTMHTRGVLLALPLIASATLTTLPPTAHAADGMLYEVSEAITLKSNGKAFKSSEATLSGRINAGTPLCPSWVTTALGTDSCWIIVHATGGADDPSGVGPIRGTMFVMAELRNAADAPELQILSADFSGQLDLSAALLQQIPRGTIVGKYSARGEQNSIMDGYKIQGAFQGVFRIPFLYGQQPSYLLDDGSVVPLELNEYSIGQPTPRLELTFTNKK